MASVSVLLFELLPREEILEILRPRANVELSRIQFVEPIYFEIGAWMVPRLLQLNSTQINWIDSSLPSWIMRHWFGVSANAALNSRWTQFINHAHYKIIDSNVMDQANVTKIHTPPICQTLSPPLPWRACTVQRKFRELSRTANYRKSLLTRRPLLKTAAPLLFANWTKAQSSTAQTNYVMPAIISIRKFKNLPLRPRFSKRCKTWSIHFVVW